MPSDKNTLDMINRIYAEAARAHRDDPLKIASHVEALVEALNPADRLAVREAFERMASVAATDRPFGGTRH